MATRWKPLLLCLVSLNFGAAQHILSINICTNCNCSDTSGSFEPSCAGKQVYYNDLFDKKCLSSEEECAQCNPSGILCTESFYTQLWKRYPAYVIGIAVAFILGTILVITLVCWTCCGRTSQLQRAPQPRSNNTHAEFDSLRDADPSTSPGAPDTKRGGSFETRN